MIKSQRHRLFKNDFFGIKEKVFFRKVTKRLLNINKLSAEGIKCLLDIVTIIGIPRNEEERDELKWACERYDSLIEEINSNINRAKNFCDKCN